MSLPPPLPRPDVGPLPTDVPALPPAQALSLEELMHWSMGEPQVDQAVRDAARVALTRRLALLTPGQDGPLDQLVALARTVTHAPVAFLGAIGEDFDHYKGLDGAPEPLATARRLEGRTFCHYTHAAGRTVALEDTAGLPAPWCDVPTVKTMGIAAYLGVPVRIDGHVVASLCVIDFKPRPWLALERSLLEALAKSFERELENRLNLATWRQLAGERQDLIVHNERLTAGVAHDLRTPLMVTQLCAASLASRPSEDTARSTAPRLKAAADHMRQLLADLQSDGQASAAPSADAQVRVDNLLLQVQRMHLPLAARDGVTLVVAVTHPRALVGDLAPALRAVANLVGNALKFSPPQSEVRLTSVVVDAQALPAVLASAPQGTAAPEHGWAEITVADQGCGMPPDELARCTQRGFQGEASLARGDGTGLGLAIVQEIAQRHGAWLHLDSTVGQGTTARLYWPLAAQAPRAPR